MASCIIQLPWGHRVATVWKISLWIQANITADEYDWIDDFSAIVFYDEETALVFKLTFQL